MDVFARLVFPEGGQCAVVYNYWWLVRNELAPRFTVVSLLGMVEKTLSWRSRIRYWKWLKL